MRNDLGRACARCGLRLPNGLEKCPSCASPTGSVNAALVPEVGWRKAFTGVRPVRDALLWIPAALLFLAVFVLAASLSAVSIPSSPPDVSGGAVVGFAAISFLGCFAGFGLIAGILWAPWAATVGIISWLAKRKKRQLLRVAPFAGNVPRRRRRLFAIYDPIDSFFTRHKWRIWIFGFVALLGLELGAEIFSAKPFFAEKTALESLKIMGTAVLIQALFLAIFYVPISYLFIVVSFVSEKMIELESAMYHFSWLWAATDSDAARLQLGEGRESASGVARVLDDAELVAPLSGERCLAFRLRGRIGSLEIDDGEMIPLAIATGDETTIARAKTSVVALEEPDRMLDHLDQPQRERVLEFLRARDIAIEFADLELGESVLSAGANVDVFGAASSERIAGEGYRDAAFRKVIDDSDGEPLLLARVD